MITPPTNDKPVSVQLTPATGAFDPCPELVSRKVSDLTQAFHDQEAVKAILAGGDRLVYEARFSPFRTGTSDMALCVTIIFPGKVGDEYHMTKGHFHARDDQPEIYHCIQGEGFLQMMTREGEYYAHPWKADTISHIPPQYAHRVVNTGTEPLVFVAVFHSAAGHLYGPIEERGFKYRIVEQDGRPVEVRNPLWG